MYQEEVQVEEEKLDLSKKQNLAEDSESEINKDITSEDVFSQPGLELKTNDIKNVSQATNAHLILESSEKVGGLYLGDVHAAGDVSYLTQNNITCILTFAKTSFTPPKHLGLQTMKIAVMDSGNVKLTTHFEKCFKFIHEHRSAGRNVLVHCLAGISRSASIVIGYLMTMEEKSFEEAFNYVKEKRCIVCPNSGFLKQLKNYDIELVTKRKKGIKTSDEKSSWSSGFLKVFGIKN